MWVASSTKGGDISLDGYDGQTDVFFQVYGFSGSIFSQGTYVVVDNGGGTYTVTMNTVLQDGSNNAARVDGHIPGHARLHQHRSVFPESWWVVDHGLVPRLYMGVREAVLSVASEHAMM